MAKKISDLTPATALGDNDSFVFNDVAAGNDKRVTAAGLKSALDLATNEYVDNKASLSGIDGVDSLLNINTTPLKDGDTGNLLNYYSDLSGGGSRIVWRPDESKANHDGIIIFNPDHLSVIGSANWYKSDGDNTVTTGTGCWVRSLDNNEITFTQAGARRGGTDSYIAIQSLIDYISSHPTKSGSKNYKGIIDGSFTYETVLKTYPNLSIRGIGPISSSKLIPNGCEALRVVGEDYHGGFGNTFRIEVRDFIIDGSAAVGTDLCLVKDSYRVVIDNIWMQDVASTCNNAFTVMGRCNHNEFNYVMATGSGSSVNTGLKVDIDEVSKATFMMPDFESFYYAFNILGGAVDIYSPYSEKSNRKFWFTTSASARTVNLFGGDIRNGGSAQGFYFEGDLSNLTCNIYSPKFHSTDGNPTKNGIRTSQITVMGDINIYGVDPKYLDDERGRINLYGAAQHEHLFHNERMIVKSLNENTVTNIARFSFMGDVTNANLQPYKVATVTVKAMMGPGGNGRGFTIGSFCMVLTTTNVMTTTGFITTAESYGGNASHSVTSITLGKSNVNNYGYLTCSIDLSGSGITDPNDVIFHVEVNSNARTEIKTDV